MANDLIDRLSSGHLPDLILPTESAAASVLKYWAMDGVE